MKSATAQAAWALTLILTFAVVLPIGMLVIVLDFIWREVWAWCLR